MPQRPVSLEIYRTAIPMRKFEHAAGSRELAEAIVVRLERPDGAVGWGETLPRPYVTGETLESVVQDIRQVLWPMVRAGHGLPWEAPQAGGPRRITAARCAVELALVDADARAAGRRLCGPLPPVRVSGVIGSSDPARTARTLRLLRLLGLRDFKLKLGLGDEVDRENLRIVHARLARGLRAGRLSLRVDINGGWAADQTPARVDELRPLGVCLVEQPVFCPAPELADLARRCSLPLLADESLVTPADAEALAQAGPDRIAFNIRISKNGGLDLARRLAELAQRHGITVVAGCMVGESGILSAAQRCLLSSAPPPRFVEGNYGRFLLADDLTRPSPRFGYGGRLAAMKGPGLGVTVDPRRLARHGRLIDRLV